MRWIVIVLLMCNGIYFLWQNYLVQKERPADPVVTKQLPAATAGLTLLSERPTDAVQKAGSDRFTDEPAVIPMSEKGASQSVATNICWQIGPFKEEVSGKQVVSRLAALDINLKLESIEIPDNPDYWVHIPPQVSRREAIKLLRELQAKKIDSFLITEGELADGISLGFFTQQDRAEVVHALRRKQGYDAQIKPIPRAHTELWAVFNEREYGKFSDALWQKITEGNQGLERRKNYCDKIASTEHID